MRGLIHRIQVWWHMWLDVRFKVYWITIMSLMPVNFYLWSPLLRPEWYQGQLNLPEATGFFSLFWLVVCTFSIPFLEGAYKFEMRIEDKVIRHRNRQKAQGGEISLTEDQS